MHQIGSFQCRQFVTDDMTLRADQNEKDELLDVTRSADTCVNCDSVSNIVLAADG